MTVLIGTSGFSYKDWVGPVYPEGLPKAEWLAFYSGEFPTCELNFSYYRIPAARTLARMADKVPEGFLFTVKAYRVIAHKLMSELHRTSNLLPTQDPLTDTRHRRDPFIPFQMDGTPTRRTDQKDLTGFS